MFKKIKKHIQTQFRLVHVAGSLAGYNKILTPELAMTEKASRTSQTEYSMGRDFVTGVIDYVGMRNLADFAKMSPPTSSVQIEILEEAKVLFTTSEYTGISDKSVQNCINYLYYYHMASSEGRNSDSEYIDWNQISLEDAKDFELFQSLRRIALLVLECELAGDYHAGMETLISSGVIRHL